MNSASNAPRMPANPPAFVLPRTGKAPLQFTGALLVTAAVTHQQGHERCRLTVYETPKGFIAHVQISPLPGSAGTSLVQEADDPAALRRWITSFDPAVAVDVSDISDTAPKASDDDDARLTLAASAIKLRLAEMRNAYLSVVQAALGEGLCGPQSFPTP